jgi:hypothetical protein
MLLKNLKVITLVDDYFNQTTNSSREASSSSSFYTVLTLWTHLNVTCLLVYVIMGFLLTLPRLTRNVQSWRLKLKLALATLLSHLVVYVVPIWAPTNLLASVWFYLLECDPAFQPVLAASVLFFMFTIDFLK